MIDVQVVPAHPASIVLRDELPEKKQPVAKEPKKKKHHTGPVLIQSKKEMDEKWGTLTKRAQTIIKNCKE